MGAHGRGFRGGRLGEGDVAYADRGKPFEEETTLENLSVRGAYFLLDNDPDPNQPLQVEIRVAEEVEQGKPTQIIESRVVRNQNVKVADQSKRGIGVSFS